MRHTYLFEEADWEARGAMTVEGGPAESVTGGARMRHHDDVWLLEGWMGEFRNSYRITPFEPEDGWTEWVSENRDIGTLHGRFALVADCILSSFTSDDGRYTGIEVLRRLADDYYQSRGVFFEGAVRLSSWEITLRHTTD